MNGVSVVVLVQNHSNEISALITKIDSVFTAKHIVYEIIFVTSKPNAALEKAVDMYPNLPLQYHVFDNHSSRQLFAQAIATAAYSTIGFVTNNQINSVDRAVDDFIANATKQPIAIIPYRRHAIGKRACVFVSGIVKYSYGSVPLWMIFDVYAGMRFVQKELLMDAEFNGMGPRITPAFLARVTAHGGVVHGYGLTSPQTGSVQTKIAQFWQRLAPERYEEFDTAYQIIHGSGFRYRGREYITHNKLPRKSTAVERTTPRQRIVMMAIVAAAILGILIDGDIMLVTVI